MGWVAGRLATVEVVIFTTYFQAGAHRTCVERGGGGNGFCCSEVSFRERERTAGGTGWGGGGGAAEIPTCV